MLRGEGELRDQEDKATKIAMHRHFAGDSDLHLIPVKYSI
jgi:hypothetical protein